MNSKYIQLINELKKHQNEWLKATFLAGALSISRRSVINYIKDINDILPNSIFSSNLGYKINIDNIKNSNFLNERNISQLPEERRNIIFKMLIESQTNEIDYFELANILYISDSTLKNDINDLNRLLQSFNLRIRVSKNSLTLSGKEIDKRRYLTSIIYRESEQNFFNLTKIQDYFSDFSIQNIKRIVKETIEQNKVFINDFTLYNLVLHLAITVDRIQNNNYIENNPDTLLIDNQNDLSFIIASSIFNKLSEIYEISNSINEIKSFAFLFQTNINRNSHDQEAFLHEHIPSSIIEIANQINSHLFNNFGIDLKFENFYSRFILHLYNLLERLENKNHMKNPLTSSIKNSCPLIYETGVHAAQIISRYIPETINEDEIAYLAFHIGSAIESEKYLNTRLKVQVIFPGYYDMQQKFIDSLKRRFDDRIIIMDATTEIIELDSSIDFVISTIPLDKKIKAIFVSPFLNESDIKLVDNFISQYSNEKVISYMNENINRLFKNNYFEINPLGTSKEELINIMCKRMLHDNIVDEHFVQHVLDRERMSSTAFGFIAIPHSIYPEANTSSVYIQLFHNGFLWDDRKVLIVLLLAVSTENRETFYQTYDFIVDRLLDNNRTISLVHSKDFQQFLNELLK